jgi:hypothetical protein
VSDDPCVTSSRDTGTYEITFRGSLTPALRRAFGDLQVVQDRPDTILRGPLGDQAALQGVLQRLLRLGLELIEVHACGDGPVDRGRAPGIDDGQGDP